jgi:hypothetical protein
LVLAGVVAEIRRMVLQRAEDAREAERQRVLAIERAADQARLAAERVRLAAEEAERARVAEEARRRQPVVAAPVFNPLGRPPADAAAARRAKVVHVLSASAARVRSTSASRRSRSR